MPVVARDEKSIVNPFYKCGNIKNVLSNEKFASLFNSTLKAISIISLALAIKHLHSNEIVHKNISPSSIMVNKHFEPVLANVSMVYDYGMQNISRQSSSQTQT